MGGPPRGLVCRGQERVGLGDMAPRDHRSPSSPQVQSVDIAAFNKI